MAHGRDRAPAGSALRGLLLSGDRLRAFRADTAPRGRRPRASTSRAGRPAAVPSPMSAARVRRCSLARAIARLSRTRAGCSELTSRIMKASPPFFPPGDGAQGREMGEALTPKYETPTTFSQIFFARRAVRQGLRDEVSARLHGLDARSEAYAGSSRRRRPHSLSISIPVFGPFMPPVQKVGRAVMAG